MADGPDAALRVFEVAPDWTLPDLDRLLPPGGRIEVTTTSEVLSHYDTRDGDLAAASIRLCRPAGAGAAWRLVIGAATITVPPTGRGVPAAIRERLLGVRAGHALRVVGRTDTDRATHRLLDADGAEVGEIVDVTRRDSTPGAGAELAVHRRVEIAGWAGPFLPAAARCLRKAGATPLECPPPPALAQTLGGALQRYLAEQRAALLRVDVALRDGWTASPRDGSTAAPRDGDTPIHGLRVAIRRLRSALRVIDVTEPEPRAALDAELSWFAGLLGTIRDREVLREHLGADDDTASLDAAMTLVRSVLDTEEAAARAELARAMAGRRYLGLLRTLREWSVAPPLTAAAAEPATRLTRYVAGAAHRMDKQLTRAGGASDPDTGLHRARKAAKRARYAANLATPVIGKPARKVARAAKRVQQDLGEHQDAVVAAAFLRRVATGAGPDAAFGCGVRWAHEQAQVAETRRRVIG